MSLRAHDQAHIRYPSGRKGKERLRQLSFLLMTVLAQTFFTLVGSHLVAFSFLSAWHIGQY